MAADSDGVDTATSGGSCGVVVTCEGDLHDPRFPARLRRLLRELRTLLAEPHPHTLKVNKVEPWNSVRVTLSVPRAAAARLRALAAAGAPQLRALGILSVQLDGDAAVSLRLHHGHELRINTHADEASTSRPSGETLAALGGLGRLLADDGASTSAAEPVEPFKSPNTVCPRDNKIPTQTIPTTPSAERCEYPFGSMTQARVIHRKENTLGIAGPANSPRLPTPSTPGPVSSPAPGPAGVVGQAIPGPVGSPRGTAPPPYPAPPVALSSPLLVNLLQNDAPAPSPRAKPSHHPAKLDALEDGQVELAVGRAPFEYRCVRPTATTPRPPRGPLPRRAVPPRPLTVPYRPPVSTPRRMPYPSEGFHPPPPYRQQPPRPRVPVPAAGPQVSNQAPAAAGLPARVSQEDLQALMPPSTTSMDQKTQSSFQEFQRYQQQYNARQRAASRGAGTAGSTSWNEPYRDALSGLTLPELPESCDLDLLLPTLGGDLHLDDAALSDISELDAYGPAVPPEPAPPSDTLLQDITGLTSTLQPYQRQTEPVMPPPAAPAPRPTPTPPQQQQQQLPAPPTPTQTPPPPFKSPPPTPGPAPPLPTQSTSAATMGPPIRLPLRAAPSVATATVGSQATAQEIEEQSKQYLIKTLMRDDDVPPPKEREKPEEVTVAQCKLRDAAPEMFGIAKSTVDEEPSRRPPKRDDKQLLKGGKPRAGVKDKVKPRPAASAQTTAALNDQPRSPGEKESLKLRLKLDKNEPVLAPVYKADMTFVAAPEEPRVPPLHISLRGRNSAVIKGKKEKKKFGPDLHKKIKIRKNSGDEKHRRDGAPADDFLVKAKLNNHFDGEAPTDPPDTSVVYRMKSISKNAHIVTKSRDYKLKSKVSNDKLKKAKINDLKEFTDLEDELMTGLATEWNNDALDKEGKYAQNEGYRETNNHQEAKKSPTVNCDKPSDPPSAVTVNTSTVTVSAISADSADVEGESRKLAGANGLLPAARKRKLSHTAVAAIPEPPGSTNVGTVGRASPPGAGRCCRLAGERDKFGSRSPAQAQGEDSGIESMDALSEKSPNQASQSPPGHRKERLDMPRSTSPASVQRIIGVQPPPAPDELLPDTDDLADLEAELAKMHGDHTRGLNGDSAPAPRPPTPILAAPDKGDDFDLPSRVSPPLYTYSNPDKAPPPDLDVKEEKPPPTLVAENGDVKPEPDDEDTEKVEPKLERLPMKADFPDKSLLEQLLIEIPTTEYPGKRPESPSPSALERVARSSVRTRSSSKLSSPADGAKTPKLSPAAPAVAPAAPPPTPAPPVVGPPSATTTKPPVVTKRKRRESESSCASAVSCEEGLSPCGRPKKKPRRPDGLKPPGDKGKKDSDSDSDEPLICKVRGKGKPGKPLTVPPSRGPEPVTRRSVRHGPPAVPVPAVVPVPPQTPAPPATPTPPAAPPVRRKTRSAAGEGAALAAGGVRRRRGSRDGK